MVKLSDVSLISLVWPFWVWKDTHAPFMSELTWFTNFSIKSVLDNDERIKNEFLWKTVLIPDEEVFRVLDKFDLSGRIVNGFPRTLNQAYYMREKYNNLLLVILDAEKDVIAQRLANRLVCSNCWLSYNRCLEKLSLWDSCKGHNCSWQLIQRPEDTKDNIERRFWVYRDIILPTIEYASNYFRTVRINLNSWDIQENQLIIEKSLELED